MEMMFNIRIVENIQARLPDVEKYAFSGLTKHLDKKYQFVHCRTWEDDVRAKYVPSEHTGA